MAPGSPPCLLLRMLILLVQISQSLAQTMATGTGQRRDEHSETLALCRRALGRCSMVRGRQMGSKHSAGCDTSVTRGTNRKRLAAPSAGCFWPLASGFAATRSPGRSRTYVASPDSKSGGPCRQTNRGMWGPANPRIRCRLAGCRLRIELLHPTVDRPLDRPEPSVRMAWSGRIPAHAVPLSAPSDSYSPCRARTYG